MNCTPLVRVLSPLLLVASAACGSDDDKSCDPIAKSGCDDGFVCEYVEAGEPACFTPLVIHGTVLDLSDEGAIAGAHIVALDVNGSPVSSVAISEADGTYDLGDFRAWILAHPDLPLTAEVLALVGPRTVVVPLLPTVPGSGGEVRR